MPIGSYRTVMTAAPVSVTMYGSTKIPVQLCTVHGELIPLPVTAKLEIWGEP